MRTLIKYFLWNADADTFVSISSEEIKRISTFLQCSNSNKKVCLVRSESSSFDDRFFIMRYYIIKSNEI